MYADDLVILGEDPGYVQAPLDELARCCVCLRLKVDLRKTVGVVFNPCPGDGSVRWKFEGEEVPKFFFVDLVTQWSSDPTEINSAAMRHVSLFLAVCPVPQCLFGL